MNAVAYETDLQKVGKHTIRDVARRANVSITTVSRTLNTPDLVEKETAKRVWAAVEDLHYYPNTQARSLVSGRSRILGLIVSDITNPFFPELVASFEDSALKHGFDVLVTSSNYDPQRMANSVRRMIERKVEGIAIMTSEMEDHLTGQLSSRNVPLVFLDVGSASETISNIVVDYAGGIQQAVEHLIALGHERIAFVSGPAGLKSAEERSSAFLATMSSRLPRGETPVVLRGDHKVSGGVSAAEQLLLLDPRPTAVVASNDLTAVGMLRAVRAAGLSVPGDLSVVGFDDIWLAEYTDPPLTTVRLSRTAIAEAACSALMSDLGARPENGNGREYRLSTQLVIRSTTARV